MNDSKRFSPLSDEERKFNWHSIFDRAWLLAVTILVLLALKAGHNRVNEIQQGRALVAKISCGTSQAFLQANQEIIEGREQQHETPAQERAVERLGFGTKSEREIQQHQQGQAYVESVKAAIVLFAGPAASNVIELRLTSKPDSHLVGVVNCANVQKITGTH